MSWYINSLLRISPKRVKKLIGIFFIGFFSFGFLLHKNIHSSYFIQALVSPSHKVRRSLLHEFLLIGFFSFGFLLRKNIHSLFFYMSMGFPKAQSETWVVPTQFVSPYC